MRVGTGRRSLLTVAAVSMFGAALGIYVVGCVSKQSSTRAKKPSIAFNNADFYDKDGKFIEEKGKDAVIALMRYHGYSLADVIDKDRSSLWVSDYETGQFTKLGLAARMWKNNEKDRYMLMDLFLLPGQMLPEHWHLADKGNPVKMEGWLIRHGLSHVVGEGEANLSPEIKIPACHDGGKVTVKCATVATPGVFVPLNKAEAHHWQFGGPEGAIITEVANVHTNSGVRHKDQAMNDYFLGN